MPSDAVTRVVTVEIQGQRYPVRSALDAGYVAELATYVDDKMQAAAVQTRAADSLRIAVLAALNIADEYFRCRGADRETTAELLRRTAGLEQLIDKALADGQ